MMFLELRKLGNICCGHKMFLNKIRNIFVSRTQNLCRQQMLRARANGETFVSATMCRQQCVLVCQGLKFCFANNLDFVRNLGRLVISIFFKTIHVCNTHCVSSLQYITNEGTLFTFKTNLNAPRYKLINVDFSKPEMVSTLKIKVKSVIYKKS